MSGRAKEWAETTWRRRDLSAGAKVVLMVLADRHQFPTSSNPELGCFPSQEDIAERSGMARSTVNRHLDDLVAAGIIERERRNNTEKRGRESTRYRLVGLDPMSDCSDMEDGSMSASMSDPMSDCSDTNLSFNPSLNPSKRSSSNARTGARETSTTTTAALEHLDDDPFRWAEDGEPPDPNDTVHRAILGALGLPPKGKWISRKQRSITAEWLALVARTPEGQAIFDREIMPRIGALAEERQRTHGLTLNSLAYFNHWISDMTRSPSQPRLTAEEMRGAIMRGLKKGTADA